jgi:hypothetical protein
MDIPDGRRRAMRGFDVVSPPTTATRCGARCRATGAGGRLRRRTAPAEELLSGDADQDLAVVVAVSEDRGRDPPPPGTPAAHASEAKARETRRWTLSHFWTGAPTARASMPSLTFGRRRRRRESSSTARWRLLSIRWRLPASTRSSTRRSRSKPSSAPSVACSRVVSGGCLDDRVPRAGLHALLWHRANTMPHCAGSR